MKIKLEKSYLKEFAKLKPNQQKKVLNRLQIFKQNPFDPILKNHALHGKLNGFRSITAGGDLRIIFREEDDYVVVIFIHVGTHNQVY